MNKITEYWRILQGKCPKCSRELVVNWWWEDYDCYSYKEVVEHCPKCHWERRYGGPVEGFNRNV